MQPAEASVSLYNQPRNNPTHNPLFNRLLVTLDRCVEIKLSTSQFIGTGKQILLPLDKSRATVSLYSQSLC